VSVTRYVLCVAGSCIQLSPLPHLTHCLYILFIAFPVGLGGRRTALSVNEASYEWRRPASGARSPDRVLCRGPGLSLPGVLLEGPRDTLRSLSDFAHRPGLQVAPARKTGLCIVGQDCRGPGSPSRDPGMPRDFSWALCIAGVLSVRRSGSSALLFTPV
jgi:hypothetical protein